VSELPPTGGPSSSESPAWTDFDWSRERYEDLVRHVVPDYDSQAGLIAQELSAAAAAAGGRPFRILELGAGTGSLSRHLLGTFPAAVVTAVDVSPVMLAECRRTLGTYGARAEVVEADFGEAELAAGPVFDAVVSRLAIHHLDDAGKETLLQRVFAALRPGGVFVNGDMITGGGEAEKAAMLAEWRRYMTSRGDDPAEWEQWLVGEDDKPATEGANLEWLRSAGFTDVRTLWKLATFAMFRAVRPAGGPAEG
jgi:tRNA (cmo5U34)-methyltransferase